MDPQRERIEADLRGLVGGTVRCDELFCQMYATDASLYEIRPIAVVRPRSTDDVVACVRYAADHKLPIHARGAGTGLAGESLGPGIVLDFSHSMRRVLRVENDLVTVQPGVIHGKLNRALARDGRMFGPDPATGGVTTMGSVIALDGAGSHWLAYGSARRHIVSLTVVLASGDVVETSSLKADSIAPTIAARIGELVKRESNLIKENWPQSAVNRCGYQIHDLPTDGPIDLAKVICGSEGTLGLVTQATVRSVPLPRHQGQLLLFFERLDLAATAAVEAAAMGVVACDLFDRRLLTLARDLDSRYAKVIPREAEAMLLVEVHGGDEKHVTEQLQQLTMNIRWRSKLAFDAHHTTESSEMEFYRRLARRVVPTLYRIRGAARPIPFVEDIAVPPDQLATFLTRLQNTLKQYEITASLYGHAGHGQLHIRPMLDPADPNELRKMQPFAADLYEHVVQLRGTICGEHGAGLSRTWFMRRQFGPLYDVFREVKRIFDPENILNPGKVVAEVPQPLTKNLRSVADRPDTQVVAATEKKVVELLLNWSPSDVAAMSQSCNGCGRCRTQSPDYRMCPTFRITQGEEASPRAKANLLRSILAEASGEEEFRGHALKQVADFCVNCHQCRMECPAGVDIPKLVVETKAQYVASNGLDSGDWILARLDWLAAWSMRVRPLANWAIGNRVMRWILQKTLGIAQGRKLPRLASRTFLKSASRRKLTRPVDESPRKVVYFVDIFANWFDTEVAEATVAVLQHNGVAVYVHPNQLPSGMAKITLGDIERARKIAKLNIARLAECVRRGYEVVTSEPSAALCLKHEYLHLFQDEDARLVAEHTHDATDYLWRLHGEGKLSVQMKPQNLTIGYHLPCHLRALSDDSPGEQLLRLIPGLRVERIERGCSGMAGTYGLNEKNFRSSLRAGFGLIAALRNPSIQVGATECSACKIQMEQGTKKPTVHPLKLLAIAYGLLPHLAEQLTESSEKLYVT